MRYCLILTTTCLLVFSGTGRAEEKQPPSSPPPATFKGSVLLLKTLQVASNFSPDKRAATVLFGGAGLQVDVGGKHSPDVSTQSASIKIELAEHKEPVKLHLDVRGFTSIDDGARATLIVRAAGESSVINLADTKLIKGKNKEPGKGKVNEKTKEGDFVISLDPTLPKGRTLYVTLFLLVERDGDNPDVGAVIQMDSVDLEILKAGAKKKKPKN